MTFAQHTADDMTRALLIAGLALALGARLSRLLAHSHGWRRTLVWALLLAPMLTPALLVSYAYSHLALRLMAVANAKESLYFAALALKFVPLATLIFHFVPRAISAEAVRCHELLGGLTVEHLIFRLRGAGRAPWLAGALVFLFAFTDFELASLWSLKTWTVALFDAQVGGLALGESLRLAALPLAIETAVLALVLRRPALSVASNGAEKVPTRASRVALLAYLGVAALLICGWPLFFVMMQAAAGFRAILENFVLANDLAASLAFAAGAAICAWLLAASFARRRAALACALPGLLGALLLALFVLTAFQFSALRPAYDTPVPLLVTLTLLLLPFALPLRWLLDFSRHDPALHLAHLARSSPLVWRLDTRRRWLAVFLLFCWAYFDFTAGSILAPAGLTPVFVRLHNLAHYGQTAVLSAMFLAAFAAPVAVLLLTAPAARWYARR